MNSIRRYLRYLFGANSFESFVIGCFVLHGILAVFLYEVGILPGTIINAVSCVVYAVCFCFKGEKEQTAIFIFYLEIGLFSALMTTLLSARSGFFLYCLPLPITSYLVIKDRGKRKGIFIGAIFLVLLEIPLSIVGETFFGGYRLLAEPYIYFTLLVNMAIVAFSNVFAVSYMVDRDKATSEAQYKSEHDALTGLCNRTFFNRYIKNLAAEGPIRGAVIMFDIDNFKLVNDQYGHDIGDLALKMVAKVAKGLVRSEDVAVRWGGEEFIIFIKDMELKKAADKAEEIRAAIEETPYYEDKVITVTLGVTDTYGSETFETVIKRADDNLYAGKTSGKNKVVASAL